MQHDNNFGRLVFTRKSGQGFYIGDDTFISVHNQDDGIHAMIFSGSNLESLRVKPNETIHRPGGIQIEIDHSTKHPRAGLRVMVLAPKDVRILREELKD